MSERKIRMYRIFKFKFEAIFQLMIGIITLLLLSASFHGKLF